MNVSGDSSIPCLGGSLADWLESQILRHRPWFEGRKLLLDVGAYRGDFALRLLDFPGSPFDQAILFEPNPVSFQALQGRLGADRRIGLEAKACDSHSGAGKLRCQGEAYTASLLAYQAPRPGKRTEQEVTVIRLDDFLSQDRVTGVGLIKVDTQGNDLRVLQGAVRLLQTSRPWVVVEMLATPRFVHQAKPVDLAGFLESQNYFLAAQMNDFYTSTGWLAWFDACFAPQELFSMDPSANLPRPTALEAATGRRRGASWRRRLGRIFHI